MSQDISITNTNLMQRLEQLEQGYHRISTESVQMHARFRSAQRRLRVQAGLAFVALVGVIAVAPGSRAALAQGYGVTLQQVAASLATAQSSITAMQSRTTALENRATTLEGKTQFITASANGKWTAITGANLFIQNGLGSTNGIPGIPFSTYMPVTNGLGNLIIGYNAYGNTRGDARNGSHNLILGDANSYTSYGGIIAGFNNTISGAYATVTGGIENVASGPNSTVSGGLFNFATGTQASVSGGAQNTAGGTNSTVSGGAGNVAGGANTTVGGGFGLTYNTDFGWAAGNYRTP